MSEYPSSCQARSGAGAVAAKLALKDRIIAIDRAGRARIQIDERVVDGSLESVGVCCDCGNDPEDVPHDTFGRGPVRPAEQQHIPILRHRGNRIRKTLFEPMVENDVVLEDQDVSGPAFPGPSVIPTWLIRQP